MDDTVELLDRLSKSLKGMKGQAAEAQAEINRLNTQRDQIHGNIVRQAQQDAAEARENMLKAAKANAKTIIDDAKAEADRLLRDARAQAAALVSEGEQRVRALEASVITERAKALLSERAAAE
jgi:cell division septum initiation protein DivIVA